jgi:hypothetical protein
VTNAAYPNGIDGALTGAIDLDTGVIKAALVRGYTYSTAHTFMSDVTTAGGTVNASSAALSSVTVSGGVLNAANTTITTTASAVNHALIIYQSSAPTGGADVAASSQRLLYYLDTGTGLPIQPGTGTVNVNWDTGTNKIAKYG